MKPWKILSSYTVDTPPFLVGDTYTDVEAHMQKVANEKSVRKDRPPIGELTFKHLYNGDARQVHGFFVNKHGNKVRFMKVEEEEPVHPALRIFNVVCAFGQFGGQALRCMTPLNKIPPREIDILERIIRDAAAHYRDEDPEKWPELHRLGERLEASLRGGR
jgi:hypothetical protein